MDKGTLDALFYEEHSEVVHKIEKHLLSWYKQAKDKIIIISMLQSHILANVLSYFQDCSISIHEALIPNSKMYPFMVVI